MGENIIKIKKHKCKICKQKYDLTTNMLKRYSHKEGLFLTETGYYIGFTCPYCHALYIYSQNLIPLFKLPDVNGEFVEIDRKNDEEK